MVRRDATATVAANAYVFPGGVVRADDYSPMMAESDRFSAKQVCAALSDRGGKPLDSTHPRACARRRWALLNCLSHAVPLAAALNLSIH